MMHQCGKPIRLFLDIQRDEVFFVVEQVPAAAAEGFLVAEPVFEGAEAGGVRFGEREHLAAAEERFFWCGL